MSVPSSRRSKSRVRRGRSHLHMKITHLGTCVVCGEKKASHQACKACGTYNGRTVIDQTKEDARLLKKTHAHESEETKVASNEETSKA